jgi:hypothetical protein
MKCTNLPHGRKIWPLGVINDFHTILFIFKLRHNFVYHNFDLEDTQSVYQYPTRQASDFYIPTSSTNRGRDNVVNKGFAKFNALQADFKSENSISRFNSLLLDHLFSSDICFFLFLLLRFFEKFLLKMKMK